MSKKEHITETLRKGVVDLQKSFKEYSKKYIADIKKVNLKYKPKTTLKAPSPRPLRELRRGRR